MTTQNVRTDFILTHAFAHFRRSFHPIELPTLDPLNPTEENVLKRVVILCKIIDHFYLEKMYNLVCNFFRVEQIKLEELLYSLYDQIFPNHITWYRILLFIEIITCIAVTYRPNELLFNYFSKIVKEKLQPWIEEHNGWETVDIDEKMEFPDVNFDHILLRRSKRLAGKERVKYI